MFRRKLRALNFPQPEAMDVEDDACVRKMVIWLEDQKIRQYRIEDRKGLREIESPEWKDAFARYLSDVSCPYSIEAPFAQLLDWLMGFAVSLDYNEDADKYKEVTGAQIAEQRNKPKLASDNPLDKLDFESSEFKQGVSQLAQVCKIPQHPDHLITLKAVSKFVRHRLSDQAIKDVNEGKTKKLEGTPYKLDQYQLGVETGDYVLNNAARGLRLLHVQELRETQTKINETIVAVQTLTANPKTDERLGKVGVM